MAAHDNLNAKQLAMFMTPNEIHADFRPNPSDLMFDGSGDADVMWATKRAHAESGDQLAAHIREHGVRDPIHLMHGPTSTVDYNFVRNGHHRLAVATDIDPERLVPVWHSDRENYHGPPYDRSLPGVNYQ